MEATTGRADEHALDRAGSDMGAYSRTGALERARALGPPAPSSRRT
jgi:hypothetical protein